MIRRLGAHKVQDRRGHDNHVLTAARDDCQAEANQLLFFLPHLLSASYQSLLSSMEQSCWQSGQVACNNQCKNRGHTIQRLHRPKNFEHEYGHSTLRRSGRYFCFGPGRLWLFSITVANSSRAIGSPGSPHRRLFGRFPSTKSMPDRIILCLCSGTFDL